MDNTIDREAKAVAAKIVNLVIKAEDRRLTESGVDPATVSEILMNGTVAALVGVFRCSKIGDEEELVEVLRGCLRGFDNVSGKEQPRH